MQGAAEKREGVRRAKRRGTEEDAGGDEAARGLCGIPKEQNFITLFLWMIMILL